MNKSKNKINKNTRRLIIVVTIVFVCVLVFIYYKPLRSLYKSSGELSMREEQLLDEQYKAMEIKAKLAYLNTEDGIKHIAKLNGFVEPGEVVIELSEKINTVTSIKPKKNIFGKYEKIACTEHTVKDKPHYNPECIVCQKLNDIYYKQIILQEQEEAQKKAEEKSKQKELKKNKKIKENLKPEIKKEK